MKTTITGMLLVAGTLMAQYQSSDPYGGRYDRRDRDYGNGGGYGRSYGPTNPYAASQRYIDGVQREIDQIARRVNWDRWSERQFRDAIGNLERYQANAARGKFDNGRLDGAIDNLNRLLTAPEIYPREKQRLATIRDGLRAFRANRGVPPRW